MKPKIVATPRTGLHSGRMMLHSMRSSPTPSRRAASSISSGISFMNSVMTRIENPHTATGRMTPHGVPRRLIPVPATSPMTRESGIAMISSGSIIVIRNRSRTNAWPRNRCRASAYDTRIATVIWMTRPPPTITSELVK